MANGLCSLPLIRTPFWANRYVPLSMATEHFALEAFSSSANPLPTASIPRRPTTHNTTNRAATYLFMRSVPPSSLPGPTGTYLCLYRCFSSGGDVVRDLYLELADLFFVVVLCAETPSEIHAEA